MSRFSGRSGVVTGAGSGIGAAIARALAAEGAVVALLDVDEQKAKAVATEAGSECLPLGCDVADADAVRSAFRVIDRELPGLDVVVNNAGYAPPRDPAVTARAQGNMQRAATGQLPQPLEALSSLSDEDWDRMLRVHLYGTFYCAREAFARMQHAGGGVIVNMASILGISGAAAAAHYSTAKGGIIALTKSLALEGATAGIRVNAIAPGWIETPMTQDVLDSEVATLLRVQIPLHRFGTAEEIAAAALHLCSDDASYTTGQVLSVNGGLL
jgi:3-oxoacyl-[acyl-carrier protein] reductase